MPETEEEKRARWAKNAAMSYMTPAMAHAMAMSKAQSQNKYKEQFNKTKGKGYTAVTSTPELEHVKKQSVRISQNKYKSEFEKNKAKFTAVADDPETLRVKRVTNQVSKVAYAGKGSALAETRRKKQLATAEGSKRPAKPDPVETADEVPTSHSRPLEVEETIQEEPEISNRENGDSKQQEEEESQSYNQEAESYDHQEEQQNSDENTGGYQDDYQQDAPQYEEETPQSNGNTYDNHDYQTQDDGQQEDDTGAHAGGREYREADADEEEEVQELTEGGLDDFYANLG